MTDLDDLLKYIFDGRKTPFTIEFERWARGSRRFRAFAASHRDKIRSKLKNTRDEGSMLDVQAELATAALLLSEDRFTLEYERYAALKQRGPDFTVTFRTHTPFNVEVRRVRAAELDGGDSEVRLGKLMTVLCDKVRQMPPGIVNLLWLASEAAIADDHLSNAVATVRQLAERKDEAYFTRHNYDSATAFLRQFGHLSAIVLSQPGGIIIWPNAGARHKLPPDIANAIKRLPSN
jgi:hypothetical protein